MKKRFLFTVIIIGIMAISSVKAQFRIGPGVGFITETRSLLLSASANYDLPKNFGVMADYNYIFAQESSHKWWGLDLDGTYTFENQVGKGKLYALAGLNLLYYKFDVDADYVGSNSHSYTGLNIGAGWRLPIRDKMELVPEAKITLGSLSYLRLEVKLMFGL